MVAGGIWGRVYIWRLGGGIRSREVEIDGLRHVFQDIEKYRLYSNPNVLFDAHLFSIAFGCLRKHVGLMAQTENLRCDQMMSSRFGLYPKWRITNM